MAIKETVMQRPKRWDSPFSQFMTDQMVDLLLTIPPFCDMDPARFPSATPLREILKNDANIIDFHEGDIVIREGDYGSSAFMVLDGTVQVCLQSLPGDLLGRSEVQQKSWTAAIAQWWTSSKLSEVRQINKLESPAALGTRADEQGTRIFLQDVPKVLDADKTATLTAGEIFGELAALTRTPRTATVVARGPKSRLLEIRWQGLRDLIRRDPALRDHIDKLFRQNSLNVHLRETTLFTALPGTAIKAIADATVFETYGQFEWQQKFKTSSAQDGADVSLAQEPLIVKQFDYADGLILIRNGFARVSRACGDSQRTLSYLGKGHIFGLRELVHNWKSAEQIGWQQSLWAIGYVDVLRIPTAVVERAILPNLQDLPASFSQQELAAIAQRQLSADSTMAAASQVSQQAPGRKSKLETGLLEFLVEQRYINGTQSMLINLERCTRCDDCVRACAATHDNNPRFVRQGPTYNNLMVASACMHCVDPVCMIGCPTGAIGRDANNGIVTINETTCVGCATCANSCPYENIRMTEIRDRAGRRLLDTESALPILKATKCDLCTQQPAGPACQNACPHDALIRIDMSQMETLEQFLSK